MSQGAPRRLVGRIVVAVLFVASIWGGWSNASDMPTTETLGERIVSMMGTAYGLLSIPALYGVWKPGAWLWPVVLLWAILLVATASSAAGVYGGGVVGTLSAGLGTLAVVAPVVWWVRRRLLRSEAGAASQAFERSMP